MIRNENLVDFTDVLFSAQKVGYTWNGAHDILDQDEIRPMYEVTTRHYDLNDFDNIENPYGFSEDTLKIMNAFCVEHNLTSFTMVA